MEATQPELVDDLPEELEPVGSVDEAEEEVTNLPDAKRIGVQLEASAAPLVQKAQAMEIAGVEDRTAAAEWLRDELKPKRKAIEEFFAPLKASAFRFHREICDREKEVLARIPDAVVTQKILAYDREQERIRREAEERARREAEAAAEAARQSALAQALEAGEMEEAAEIQAAPPTPVLIPAEVPAPPPKVKGVAPRETWKARVTNLAAFVAWVAQSPDDRVHYVTVNQGALDGLARRLKGETNIPGVTAEPDRGLRVGRAR